MIFKFTWSFAFLTCVNDVAYRLARKDMSHAHHIFHVYLLAQFIDSNDYMPPLLPIIVNGALEYVVESVLLQRLQSSEKNFYTNISSNSRVMVRNITHKRLSPICHGNSSMITRLNEHTLLCNKHPYDHPLFHCYDIGVPVAPSCLRS